MVDGYCQRHLVHQQDPESPSHERGGQIKTPTDIPANGWILSATSRTPAGPRKPHARKARSDKTPTDIPAKYESIRLFRQHQSNGQFLTPPSYKNPGRKSFWLKNSNHRVWGLVAREDTQGHRNRSQRDEIKPGRARGRSQAQGDGTKTGRSGVKDPGESKDTRANMRRLWRKVGKRPIS